MKQEYNTRRRTRSPSLRFPFTQPRIEKLPTPAGQLAIFHDADLRGLSLRVTPNGVKTFEVLKRVNGKPVRVTLGRFPDMNLITARKRARTTLNDMADGINPNVQKREDREKALREMSFGEFFHEYVLRHAEPHTRGGAEKARRAYDLHLTGWAKKPLASIAHRDVQELHAQIARAVPLKKKDGSVANKHVGGRRAANLVVALLSHLFNTARLWGYISGDNPAKGIKKFRESPRERWLKPDEMKKFFTALAKEPNRTMRDVFITLLLTGQRKGNVMAMRWEQVNLKERTWEIPSEETKAQNMIAVPLHPHLVTLLEDRKHQTGDSPWVFPGRGATGHIQEIKKAWRELTNRAGLANFRPHDLRHTYASWQVAAGIHLRVISKALGHKSPLTVNRYAHVDVQPVRDAIQKAGDALLIAGDIQPGAVGKKVVPKKILVTPAKKMPQKISFKRVPKKILVE